VDRICYQHTPLRLALPKEKAIRLKEVVKEETIIVEKRQNQKEVSEYAMVELLESRFVILTNEKP
jgi:hypothetical protein